VKIKLDRAGLVAALRSTEAQAAMGEAAAALASRVHPTSHGQPVKVTTATHLTPVTAAGSVTIAHPGGMAMEAKHGYLAGAARSAGMKVTQRA